MIIGTATSTNVCLQHLAIKDIFQQMTLIPNKKRTQTELNVMSYLLAT